LTSYKETWGFRGTLAPQKPQKRGKGVVDYKLRLQSTTP
jgi:hypothetical protein